MEVLLSIKIIMATIKSLIYTYPFIFIIVAGIILYLLQQKAKKNRIELGVEKICPYCRETISGEAVICKHCNSKIS